MWTYPDVLTRENEPIGVHFLLKTLNAFSYLCVFLGSIGMLMFSVKFPFSTSMDDQKYTGITFCGLNGKQVWQLSWIFIMVGTLIQLVIAVAECC